MSPSRGLLFPPELRYRTGKVELILLLAIAAALPLQEWLPTLSGFSALSLAFAVVVGYVLISSPRSLGSTWNHPVFLVAYALMFFGALAETFHPLTQYAELSRIAQMFVGAICIASLCRNRSALLSLIYGLVIAGFGMSILLFLNYYEVLTQYNTTDFAGASAVRGSVFQANPLGENLNTIAFVTAQGAVLSLALALKAVSSTRRAILLAASVLCLIATFIPMSRSGVVIAAAGALMVLLSHKGKRGRTLMAAMVLGLAVALCVPSVSISRLEFSSEPVEGKVEGRARVYRAVADELPNYLLAGVGVGNFWTSWGRSSAFHRGHSVVGAHNVFFQITIYWGVIGLGLLVLLVWRCFRCLPRSAGSDPLGLCVLGIAVTVLLQALVIHNLYAKEFSIGLGVFVASSIWIWPTRKNNRRRVWY